MLKQSINGHDNIQAGGDLTIQNIEIKVKKELASATTPIRSKLIDDTPLSENRDFDNTILIKKLKNGGFNIEFRNNATRKKLDTLMIVLEYTKKQTGKDILNDIYENLLTIINFKYISQLSEGESLKSSVSDILEELSFVSEKYKSQINIDESFLEGLLYIATSRCALKWKVEGEDESVNDC